MNRELAGLIGLLLFAFVLGYAQGRLTQAQKDDNTITQAHQNENQANGLEDECKQILKEKK